METFDHLIVTLSEVLLTSEIVLGFARFNVYALVVIEYFLENELLTVLPSADAVARSFM